MRIGIFTDSYYPHISGVSTSIEMLKTALEDMGHKVLVVAPNLDNMKVIYDDKKHVIYIPGVKLGLYKLRLAETYSAKAMKIIKEKWPLDIIHTQTEFTVAKFGRTVAKKLNIPIVHTYHTLYEDYMYYLTHGHFNKLGRKIAIKVTSNYCTNKCDKLIVPTDKIKDLFVNKYNITKNMAVIPSGIDIKKFYGTNTLIQKSKQLKKKYKINPDDFIIGSVGRLASEKSFDKIIRNMVPLIKYNPKIKFLLIGDGPAKEELETLAKELKVSKNIIFTGLIDYDLIPTYYQLFDVMVSFSKTETQGLTIVEGLAASKPVVCINDDSFNDIVQNNYNGYLFNDDEEYRKYILDLVYNKELYKELSMNAKNSVYSYSKEVFASNVLKIYHEAIDEKRD